MAIGRVEDLLAHVKNDQSGEVKIPHRLTDHLQKTAELCRNFAQSFHLEKVAAILGYTHDIGKASKEFQERIKTIAGIEAHLEGKTPQHVDHSTSGAQHLIKRYGLQLGTILAYCIAGHHTGLPNGTGDEDNVLSRRLKRKICDYSQIIDWLDEKLFDLNITDIIPGAKKDKKLNNYRIQFMIRMLYSVLTDADFLDTEEFMDPEQANLRKSSNNITELYNHFQKFLRLLNQKEKTPINIKRMEILNACLKAAENQPGLYSLTVPTGGGKTISSLAFALKHANKYSMRRVIYVIPYTNIIEQNADVFRTIFHSLSEDNILEHHSNLDPTVITPFNRIAAQNWDAPIIVTTNVQFFESFYAHRSSACRKIHNVANSVIIFDEAQMLPTDFLNPCLSVIKELIEIYGCTAIICTATQPELLKSNIVKKGFEKISEIIPNPSGLYQSFKRVNINIISEKQSNDMLVQKLKQYKQVLTIVNTRKEARQIFEKLTKETDINETFHLSTMMCPQHRRESLIEILKRLKDSKPCRVISTQLIEAGVDIDFPVVFRAISGIDSIAQAAGRCNREGKQKYGKFFVFNGETLPPPGHLRKSAESGQQTIINFPKDPLSLNAITYYFNDYYWKKPEMDKKQILDLCETMPNAIPFREISKQFKIIEEPTYSIIVPFKKSGKELIEKLRKCRFSFVPINLRRESQQYIVSIREKPFFAFKRTGVLEDLFGDGQYMVLINPDIYDKHVGLKSDNPSFFEAESLII